ncbi:MAG: coproporphyrinogen III oxidase family protein [Epsilonproteobacteria bacterium]|nr:coproporphyrinogen III oxidase family protein [Campylobacterota bacterium]
MKNDKLLYIHIPFCDSKCNYCAFNSYTNLSHLKQKYLSALKIQLRFENQNNFYTLFIGGGTPSTMSVDFYYQLLQNINISKESTIEANPNVSYEWLKGIKDLGIERISFGVQSFNDKKLNFLGRNHTSTQAVKAVENAKKAGFENINIDFIYSCAVDSKNLLQKDLDIAFSLPITHISAYSLTIEERSKWSGNFSKRKNDEELEIWFINAIKEKFPQYEISNFGKKCLHNLGYWEFKEYVGIGAGAVGFKKTPSPHRYYTKTNISEYIKNPTLYTYEYLQAQDLKKEKILLGLRSITGFDENILTPKEKEKVNFLISQNKLYKKNGFIHSRDFLLADALSAYILD